MKKISEQEFIEITETFFTRLEDKMSSSSCGELFEDEFPKSICDRFDGDIELFEVWKEMFYKKIYKKI